jgi:hypothetical protein
MAEPGAVGDIRDLYPEFARCHEHDPIRRQESAFEGMPPTYTVFRHDDVTRVEALQGRLPARR